jgi:hypothetical protein
VILLVTNAIYITTLNNYRTSTLEDSVAVIPVQTPTSAVCMRYGRLQMVKLKELILRESTPKPHLENVGSAKGAKSKPNVNQHAGSV